MTENTGKKSADAERREFCRIDDEISLSYRTVTEQDVSNLVAKIREELPDRFTAASTFAATSRQMNSLLRKIQNESADLARFLEAVDTKLNMLAQLFVAEEMNIHDKPACRVNMSANGMAFSTAEPHEPGEMMELRMVLFPCLTGILTAARVVYCDKGETDAPEEAWRIAVEFCHLRVEDQDMLAKHIFSRQMEQRRQERFMDDVMDGEGKV